MRKTNKAFPSLRALCLFIQTYLSDMRHTSTLRPMESFLGRERQTAPGRTRCEGLSQAVSRIEKLSVFPGTSRGFPGRGNHESISLCNERMIPAVYVKPFWDQFWKQRKTENTEGRTMISTWHEG